MATAGAKTGEYKLDVKRDRLVIAASSLGTVFEWYDFFIYGTLAAIIGRTFFPTDNASVELLYSLAGFAVGFGFRPLGAVLFGYFGDRLGRKYTFLATIIMMGIATAGVGLVPSAASIGAAAPVILIILRIMQGLALGGEYGGAAIYVAEHAPVERRGFYTSFIQASVVGGFILSLIVVLGTQWIVGPEVWDAWGWRIPFVFSLVLLGISLWIRLKLNESPVFKAMKDAGECARNPLKETFTYPGNKKRLFVALFGIAAGLTVIWYTAMFQVLYFLQNALRVEPVTAQILVGIGATSGLFWFLFFGHLSDKYGRKKPIVLGYAATLLLLFPIFHLIGGAANPSLAEAARRAPVVVMGPDCGYDPFAKVQASDCSRLLDYFSKKGVHYSKAAAPSTQVSIAGVVQTDTSPAALDKTLADAGYNLEKVKPSFVDSLKILLGILTLGALSGATYGPVAALLSELFPARIRYSSMSIPYHIGTGYFGGFLPLVSQYIVARTGDPYSGLWYTMAVVAMALVVTMWGLPETRGARLDAKG
ncbi:MFS transporter [Sphingobium sp. CECT 9361]|uniref:MFS transporter n=1 Tax=Sphingobium sp. CECT 9361 TaxID=2845384 RepID=UPI001E2F4262|nr:MFS transporter [Sphingobium sp. CECT 9361]CAH0355953.1 Sialic acid transporter NanT [Sphingobium sp. CECT 9361]